MNNIKQVYRYTILIQVSYLFNVFLTNLKSTMSVMKNESPLLVEEMVSMAGVEKYKSKGMDTMSPRT